jgi:spore coat protein U-like protein
VALSKSASLFVRAVIVLPVTALLCSPPAYAACSVTATPIAFGNYNGVTKGEVQSVTSVTVRCNDLLLNANFTLTVSPGQSGNAMSRYLASGPYRLTYQVYTDAARTQVAGDGLAGTVSPAGSVAALAGIGTTSSSVQLYPVIAAGQSPVPGTYTDTLTILVTY